MAIDYYGTCTGYQDFQTLRDRIRQSLKQGEFAFRIPITHPGTAKQHLMFLVEIPWDPGVAKRFQAFREMLHQLKTGRARGVGIGGGGGSSRPSFRQCHPAILSLSKLRTSTRHSHHHRLKATLHEGYLEKSGVNYVSLPMLREFLDGTAPRHLKLHLRPYMRRRMQVASQFLLRMCRHMRWDSPKPYEIVTRDKIAYHVRHCETPNDPKTLDVPDSHQREFHYLDEDHELRYKDHDARRPEGEVGTLVEWPDDSSSSSGGGGAASPDGGSEQRRTDPGGGGGGHPAAAKGTGSGLRKRDTEQ